MNVSKSSIDRTEKLKACAERWWHLVGTTRHKREILQSLILRANDDASFRNGPAGVSIDLLAHTLLFDLIKDLAALTLDSDQKAPSLVNIIKLLSDGRIRSKLRIDAIEAFGANGEDAAEFDQRWLLVLQAGETILKREILRRINDERDPSIAHFEMQMRDGIRGLYEISKAGLTWGDPDLLLRDLEDFGRALLLLIAGKYYDADARRSADVESARCLWQNNWASERFDCDD
jgi:hypothetical protein